MTLPTFTAGETSGVAAGLTTVVAALTPVSDATIGTNASGFTASSQVARTLCDGKLVYVNLVTVNTSTITATGSGTPASPIDIGSTAIFTLDAAYQPDEPTVFAWTSGPVGGMGLIATSGIVTLENTTGTIAAGATIRCGGATFITA